PPAGTATRTFQVKFPDALAATFISGQYSVVIGSNIKSAAGDLLDTNMNAGLYRLEGGDPFTQPLTLADTATYAAAPGPNLDPASGRKYYDTPANGTLSLPIDI